MIYSAVWRLSKKEDKKEKSGCNHGNRKGDRDGNCVCKYVATHAQHNNQPIEAWQNKQRPVQFGTLARRRLPFSSFDSFFDNAMMEI